MNAKKYNDLQQLIKEDRVIVEVSRTLSGTAFGGKVGGWLYSVISLGIFGIIIILLVKGHFIWSLLTIIGYFMFFKLWSKLSFYYFYVRSLRNYEMFQAAYNSGIIRLRIGETGPVVSFPSSWESVFDEI